MDKLITIWSFICRRKYLITVVAFAVIIGFLDENSLFRRLGYEREIRQLKEEIEKYLKEHNLSFKVVNDEYSDFAYRFNIKVFPTTLIYDKDKNLKFSEVGYTSTLGLYLRMWWSNY